MEHRELYRTLVPEGYIITYSDLIRCGNPDGAKKIAQSIYYPLGGGYSSEAMDIGHKAHSLKEAEVGDWDNELRLSYKMADGYYLCGTIDRYYKSTKVVEDYKHTGRPASSYLKTNQVETYSFLAMNNDMTVSMGRYTTIDSEGHVLTQAPVDISEATAVTCYSTFILPRFNMIKREIERLEQQYVRDNTSDSK